MARWSRRRRPGRADDRAAAGALGGAGRGARPRARSGTPSGPRRSASSATSSTSGTPSAPAARSPTRASPGRRRARSTATRSCSPRLRRARPLGVPAVRQHLPGPHRGDPRRARSPRSRWSTCAGATRSSTSTQDDDGVTRHAAPHGTARSAAPTWWPAAAPAATRCAALLGVTFDGHTFDDRFLICDIRADLPGWATERRFYFDPEWNPGRQVLIHPCPDSTFRIDWQVPAGLRPRRRGRLRRRWTPGSGRSSATRPYEIVWKSVYRFHSRVRRPDARSAGC